MDNVSRPLWQLLLLTQDSHKTVQLTCEECFALLEYDASMLVAGASFDNIHPAIKRHLHRCPECRTKFVDWLKKLERDSGFSAGQKSIEKES